LDSLLDDDRLKEIEAKRAERKPIDWARVRLSLFLALPILCGLLVARIRLGAGRWRAAFLVAMSAEMNRLAQDSKPTVRE
jgi:hypothetical protein